MDTAILTIEQVSAMLSASRSDVREWAKSGEIPGGFELPNGELRFKAREVYEWLKSKSQQKIGAAKAPRVRAAHKMGIDP